MTGKATAFNFGGTGSHAVYGQHLEDLDNVHGKGGSCNNGTYYNP